MSTSHALSLAGVVVAALSLAVSLFVGYRARRYERRIASLEKASSVYSELLVAMYRIESLVNQATRAAPLTEEWLTDDDIASLKAKMLIGGASKRVEEATTKFTTSAKAFSDAFEDGAVDDAELEELRREVRGALRSLESVIKAEVGPDAAG